VICAGKDRVGSVWGGKYDWEGVFVRCGVLVNGVLGMRVLEG
jgi:hypothetical protein